MRWEDVPAVVDAWVLKVAADGYDLRQAAASVPTSYPAGYYIHPVTGQVGLFSLGSDSDLALCKAAAARVSAIAPPLLLSYQDLTDDDSAWIKVAYSPTLRRAGELGNFFPGQYPGGLPNSPSPLAAMLTSGLVGAGLGWGGGKLLGAVLPRQYGKKLSRTGAILGGLAGAAPGLAWGLTNKLVDQPFNDPSLLAAPPDSEPDSFPNAINGANMAPPRHKGAPTFVDAGNEFLNSTVVPKKFGSDLAAVELGSAYKQAAEKAARVFGRGGPNREREGNQEASVNVNALGHVLWESGASPALAATTMGALYAAQQMPDPESRPGWVTGNQLGSLARNAAGDYATGFLVGGALNALVGTPYRASTFGAGSAVLGVLGAVVPKLFGR